MQNDGNLVFYDNGGRAIWAAGYYSNAEPTIVSQAGSLITVDPAKDICGKRLTSCKARFGANAELPFGSFPSLGTFYG
jgi:phage-related protein